MRSIILHNQLYLCTKLDQRHPNKKTIIIKFLKKNETLICLFQ